MLDQRAATFEQVDLPDIIRGVPPFIFDINSPVKIISISPFGDLNPTINLRFDDNTNQICDLFQIRFEFPALYNSEYFSSYIAQNGYSMESLNDDQVMATTALDGEEEEQED